MSLRRSRRAPPPEVKPHAQGFNNVLLDSDRVLRRHLLAVSAASPCENKFAFNLQLALRYLEHEGILIQATPDDYLQLGSVVFKAIEPNTSAYHHLNADGHQVMLNYRDTRQVAETASLQAVLRNDFDTSILRNRIVLIGTTDQSFGDTNWHTPYSTNQETIQTIAGVEVQAHMVSQILSAVLDQRPLIRWLPTSLEVLWITAWAIAGGLLAYSLRSLPRWLLASGIVVMLLYGSCLIVLTAAGGWLPLVPSAIAFLTSGSTVMILPQLKPTWSGELE
ncbi:MAG: CHASE2 domain-containing protein [Oscillatoriales cyanobacterium C42_A2020_001]|nr:CHASE2 domain-containing protein [Leptolyngbyaceae cyanobacterium C42_A2020_001]